MTLQFSCFKKPLPEVDHRAIQLQIEKEFKQLNTLHFLLPEEQNTVVYVEEEAQLELLKIIRFLKCGLRTYELIIKLFY